MPIKAENRGRYPADWKQMTRVAALALACILAWSSTGAEPIKRSTSAKRAFQKAAPCPATGEPRGACPGYVIDHIVPLCAGGPDTPANMQWQTIAEAREKDKIEVAKCRALRKAGRDG
jgi:hypothetical protein